MAGSNLTNVSCADFARFQEALKEMRMIDDKVIYNLNKVVPTTSFKGQVDASQKCEGFYNELSSAYSGRENVIKRCISEVSTSINQLKKEKDQNPDDFKIMKDLRKRQGELRLMQSELNIEEVVKDRTLKVFHEKCRSHYTPPKKDSL
ncbi:coiled-coil domain-containing protein 58 [Strongylocentrotus purpuratus]|uniref:Protein MIX23 n=1 Tax=Strongylocentrotus purpuratus TaxID=7668 RepID=A0A7M7RDH7_STRPU|nr:coiled-coil domain-containing protein 58 [Strongylocentrotus purpuratus]|eukprot:XP_782179.2 PREDICTED: coiled-coil domain-containing protein 58 [Strongylocentrotus purpuratus]